jgi:hypothetical protein
MIIAPTQKRRPEGRRFALREALRRTKQLMRINHRLPRHARIELAIPSRRIIQANYLSPDNVRNMNTVHMIACISWRLYFITGVCPVWKPCELAQPKPDAKAAHFRGSGHRFYGAAAMRHYPFY